MATRDPIVQTAFDAVLAKYASLKAGYEPISPIPSSSETSSTCRYLEVFHKWLYGNTYDDNKHPSSDTTCSRRLQSPLVHAGYAIRLATISFTVEAFLTFHFQNCSREGNKKLQLVILGCGLDILGLWTLIAHHHNLGEESITVYDLDKPQITRIKKEMLLEQNLLHISHDTELAKEDMGILCQGRISMTPATNFSDRTCNYYLGSCDLRKTDSVARCLSTLDPAIPTLVVSELVLTYLGQTAMESILCYCANHIAVAPGSAIVALEPLGPNTKQQQYQSTWEGYKQQYCKLFVQKLSKSFARWDSTDNFFPPGPTISAVERRFQSAGFQFTFATSLGHAVTSLPVHYISSSGSPTTTSSPILFHPCPEEPFDEHAALALHVRSYAFVVAFAASRPYPDLIHMIRYLCPWSSVTKKDMEPKVVGEPPFLYNIRIIQTKDHDSVRNLYSQTYENLFEEYPSVRKLVKTALQSDLRCDPEENVESTYSSIAVRYSVAGGVFLVAVDPKNENMLFGCLGIQPYLPTKSNATFYSRAYEIHRFAVCPSQRGKGLGKSLVDVVSSFVRRENLEGESCTLIAKTPSILERANNLYQACNFHLDNEETIGTMVMRTYRKLMI
jgi:O-methyltransferase involved in polyketide biosynthesis/GNAT superfamily N-acetyltransferase